MVNLMDVFVDQGMMQHPMTIIEQDLFDQNEDWQLEDDPMKGWKDRWVIVSDHMLSQVSDS